MEDWSEASLLKFLNQLRDSLIQVRHESRVRHLEDGRFGILRQTDEISAMSKARLKRNRIENEKEWDTHLVDSNDELRVLHPCQMLDGAADTHSDV